MHEESSTKYYKLLYISYYCITTRAFIFSITALTYAKAKSNLEIDTITLLLNMRSFGG